MTNIRVVSGLDAAGTDRPIRTDSAGRVKQSHGQPDATVGILNNVGDVVPLNVEGYSDFTFFTSGTFAGASVVLEQSADSTNGVDGTWYLMSAARGDNPGTISSTLLNGATNTSLAFNGSAPGANFVRARLSAKTSGAVSIRAVASTASVSPVVGVNGSVNTVTGLEPYNTNRVETGTLLGANGVYTGSSRDNGSDLTRQWTRARAIVRHQAGLTPGTLVLQQSTDNATWVDTYRVPVPSDNIFHDFEAPLFARYHRWIFNNGATAQTVFNLWSTSSNAEGNVSDKRILPFNFSTTALAASGSFAGPALDLGLNHDWDEFRCLAWSDQAMASNGFTIQQSRDGTNWRTTDVMTSGGPGVLKLVGAVYMRYVRAAYINGATAQTGFDFNGVLSPK